VVFHFQGAQLAASARPNFPRRTKKTCSIQMMLLLEGILIGLFFGVGIGLVWGLITQKVFRTMFRSMLKTRTNRVRNEALHHVASVRRETLNLLRERAPRTETARVQAV